MRGRGGWIGSLLLAALLVAVFFSSDAGEEPPLSKQSRDGEGPPGGPQGEEVVAPVLFVIDGDTIAVELDGDEEHVRYIGIDTPEVDPSIGVECYGDEASALNKRLVTDQEVRLRFDAERHDIYGRLLAYVFVGERFINAEIVRAGAARTLTIPPNDAYAELFARLAEDAGRAGRGLWGACEA